VMDLSMQEGDGVYPNYDQAVEQYVPSTATWNLVLAASNGGNPYAYNVSATNSQFAETYSSAGNNQLIAFSLSQATNGTNLQESADAFTGSSNTVVGFASGASSTSITDWAYYPDQPFQEDWLTIDGNFLAMFDVTGDSFSPGATNGPPGAIEYLSLTEYEGAGVVVDTQNSSFVQTYYFGEGEFGSMQWSSMGAPSDTSSTPSVVVAANPN